MADFAVEKTGRLDALICSAAMDPKFDATHARNTNNFEDYPLDQWQAAVNVNLTGLFLCAQAAVKPMKKQNHGVIINICSTYGLPAPTCGSMKKKARIRTTASTNRSIIP